MSETSVYKVVAEQAQSTVVAEYAPVDYRAESYQSEAELERAFIEQLESQAYEHVRITDEESLIGNLRDRLEELNDYRFSDREWRRFFEGELANRNDGIEEKTTTIQEDYVKILARDDGSKKNVYLLSKANIHDNKLQVISQYATDSGLQANRYDVTVLVNGLPLVHVELKRRGVPIREAFNQISRYQRESFSASAGLHEYIQLFVISNGTNTKYYSNTTRNQHVKETQQGSAKYVTRSSNSFEFTSWWADAANKPIRDLVNFSRTFFAKHTLLNVLTRYCVFTTDRQLLVMRPYQIVATERILNRIAISTNHRKLGTVEAGGFIWHTTGSGKTLTSFKTAQLASRLEQVDKVLFVVDRKDLDYQTMKEYDKFEKGAANSNTSTAILQKQLENPDARIIITTIQKLDRFVRRNREHEIFKRHVVLIFDECHRSQFGEMHAAITKSFSKYHLFGFTGTPIFAANAASGGRPYPKTTEQAFGEKAHTYTIADAIADKNVLPFKVDYVSTIKEAEDIEDEQVADIDRKAALASPERVANIVRYICEHFDRKTKRNSFYKLKDRRLAGFNSIFAVASIEMAGRYYAEFKRQLSDAPSDKKLKVALIYSFGVNDEDPDGMVDENSDDTSGLDTGSRHILDGAIEDYNTLFATSYDTSSDKFQNYYKDVSERVKNREIDVLLVVNMFLTGFDATTVNTLWVDRNLRLHGLLQAFSRTNRILNSVKIFGNIVCFRKLEKATNESIALFGDREASGLVLLNTYRDYYCGFQDGDRQVRGYADLMNELLKKYPVGANIVGEQSQRDFIMLYGAILRIRNILTAFDEFKGNEILSPRDQQDYHSMYIDLYDDFRSAGDEENTNVNDDLIFEMELIKQIEINIDYILALVKKYHDGHRSDKEILVDIKKAVHSSIELRNKKDLIQQFIASLKDCSDVDRDWKRFVEDRKTEELEQIISSNQVDRDATIRFMRNAFRNGGVPTTGTALSTVLPPGGRFSPGGERTKNRERILARLTAFYDRYIGISGSEDGAKSQADSV